MMEIYNDINLRKHRAAAAMRAVVAAAMAVAAAVGLWSCERWVYEDLDPCERHYYVRFCFDMNMSYADAFAARVNSVRLYIFDSATGQLVDVCDEAGEALARADYRMEIEVQPGDYDLIAWCGLEGNDDLFALPAEVAVREDAHCRMARDYDEGGRAVQRRWLPSLFHGRASAVLPEEYGEYEVTVPLIKNTNNINLSMQHVAGQPLTADMFTVTLTDSNGHMAHDNSLTDDEAVDYYPWHVADGTVDIGGDNAARSTRSTRGTRADGENAENGGGNGETDGETLNYFMAEISTARLMADRSPRINITDNATGKLLYSIPIVDWALEFRSAQHGSMGEQEYLDREDQYNVMLYLDNKDDSGWLASSIYINGWRVVRHDDTGMGQ